MTKTMMRYLRHCVRKAIEAIDRIEAWEAVAKRISGEEADCMFAFAYMPDEELDDWTDCWTVADATMVIVGAYLQRVTATVILVFRRLKNMVSRKSEDDVE